ncbi:MAG TPA: mersacidin/lichenicidin family type 2 lantibiotic [Solirubrobacteraceae bacterium]|nr:mersacidin/lichenicidin family type 2 lantibiotic [Solirubrobacteraceae bacterium]
MAETHPQAREIIARAWRDEGYRKGLPAEVRDKLPPAPERAAQMSDEQLESAAGGTTVACAGLALAAVGLGITAEEAWDD